MTENNLEDVEIFLRRPGSDDSVRLFDATYQEMARLSTRRITGLIAEDYGKMAQGDWEVGLREQGVLKATQTFHVKNNDTHFSVQTAVDPLLSRWRK